jgi:hypothetical protein
MINRTYIVKTPTGQALFTDICLRSLMGTRLAPVADPLTYPGSTPPPAGWVAACGDGAYYEVRGRALPFDHIFAEGTAGGFTQRLNLGFHLSIVPCRSVAGITSAITNVLLSQSLLSAVGGDTGGAIVTASLPDQAYGPVIRVYNPIATPAPVSGLYMVSLSIAERKDDDYDNTGSP